MKSLIIGGTSSLGKSISEELLSRGAEIITVSRAAEGLPNREHFQCDMLNKSKLETILNTIREENAIIDNIWCVAGYAFPKRVQEQTQEVYQRHLDRNFTYVKLSLNALFDNLKRSPNSQVITLGSQWSYRPKEDFAELAPYADAKKILRKYTHTFAIENPTIKANHYCIPSTDTFTTRRIMETLSKINKVLPTSHTYLANPQVIARGLVEHALKFEGSGETLVCDVNGLVQVLV